MKIAVLGAAGKMGKWFVQYLIDKGHTLTVSDINKDELRKLSKNYNVKLTKDNIEAVRDAELTIISVPINRTVEVLWEIIPKLKRKSVIAEIASVKAEIIDVLKESSKYGVQPLSLHPLFGPMGNIKRKFALIPVLNAEKELATAKKFFPNTEIFVVDAERHDRAMAITLSLTYFVNMTFALTLKDEDFKALETLSGPTFTLQQILIGAVMMQDPELHASLHMANKHTPEYLRKFISNMEKMMKPVEHGDAEVFKSVYEGVKRDLSKSLDLAAMYKTMYDTLEIIEKSKHTH
ncbi:MAG: prephenate dehydrogenase/arogenate dehydrogenase family protein [Candidatus Bathycorpusculaceae bacterium]